MVRINVPPFTRGLLFFSVGLSLVYVAAAQRLRSPFLPWLVILPLRSVVYPWVYVTATLTESNLPALLIAGATYFYGGRYLERAWGSRDFGLFLLIVSAIPNFVAAAVYAFLTAIARGHSVTR